MPQLGSCASSGRAWRLWAARYSQEEAGPLGAQPLPRVLELAALKAADSAAFRQTRYIVEEERERTPSVGSHIAFFKNGEPQGTAFEDVWAEVHYPLPLPLLLLLALPLPLPLPYPYP